MYDQNAEVDGIGFQAHMFNVPTPPVRIYDILEEFNQLGQSYGKTLEAV